MSATVREFVWGFPTCTRIRNATVCILIGSDFQRLSKKKCDSFEMNMKNGEFLLSRPPSCGFQWARFAVGARNCFGSCQSGPFPRNYLDRARRVPDFPGFGMTARIFGENYHPPFSKIYGERPALTYLYEKCFRFHHCL